MKNLSPGNCAKCAEGEAVEETTLLLCGHAAIATIATIAADGMQAHNEPVWNWFSF